MAHADDADNAASADDGQRIAVWRVPRAALYSVDMAELSAAQDATGRLAGLGGRRVWVGERAALAPDTRPAARVEVIDRDVVAALQARMDAGDVAVPFDAQAWRAALRPGDAELWVAVPHWRPDPYPDAWPVGTVVALIVAFALGLLGLFEVLFDR